VSAMDRPLPGASTPGEVSTGSQSDTGGIGSSELVLKQLAAAHLVDHTRDRRVLAGLALLLSALPGTEIVGGADLGTVAIEYAVGGWEVFPLSGKLPQLTCPINKAHKTAGRPDRCRGDCGNDGHGVIDATGDPAKVASWWAKYPRANIGARVPAGLFVVDTDPRHGGEAAFSDLERRHSPLPPTLTCFSGRGDGGRHRYLLHPGGELCSAGLPDGIDIKTHKGYVVVPQSLHPDTGKPYRWDDLTFPPAEPPTWLVDLLRPSPRAPRPSTPRASTVNSDSVADWFDASHTWADVLEAAGWTEVYGGWRHPTATSPLSATVTNDCLFVYSTNTQFEVTETGRPYGYTKLRAWAVLHHHGDLRTAARAAIELRRAATGRLAS